MNYLDRKNNLHVLIVYIKIFKLDDNGKFIAFGAFPEFLFTQTCVDHLFTFNFCYDDFFDNSILGYK